MTTIACRDGVMASDSLECAGERRDDARNKKLFRLEDGSVFGGSGNSPMIFALLNAIEAVIWTKKLPLPPVKKTSGLLLRPNGVLWYFEPGWWYKIRDYHAIGSGADYAIGAMDTGADAVAACRAGIKRDVHSGGRVQVMEI